MLKQSDLSHFTGSENWYRLGVCRNVLLTDGTKYVAEVAGAYWLMDAVASYQPRLANHKDARLRDMQFWTLKVNADRPAVLTCIADSGETPAVTQRIEYTDFPLDESKLYAANDGEHMVIMLPSEY